MKTPKAVTIIALSAASLLGCNRRVEQELSLDDILPRAESADNQPEEGWLKAATPRSFSFPTDHGAHRDYRIEWWYYTGNLTADDGNRFGYQLTFFRTGINRETTNPSRWAVRDLYTAHFAVSDLGAAKHHSAQRSARAGVGQAGAEIGKLEVWNGNWRVEATGDTHALHASSDKMAIELELTPTGEPALHGNAGLSQKGAQHGNASYYYSFPRMEATGTVTVGGKPYKVQGNSWMDHEFSTSFLEPGQQGWDWFSLQLSDGSALMLYQMRMADGSVDPYSSGTYVAGNGKVTPLKAEEFTITPVGEPWTSATTGAEYPLRWQLEAPSLGILLNVTPAFDEQEMNTTETTGIAYWEGSISASGRAGEAEVSAEGYLELTGYAGPGLGSLLD